MLLRSLADFQIARFVGDAKLRLDGEAEKAEVKARNLVDTMKDVLKS